MSTRFKNIEMLFLAFTVFLSSSLNLNAFEIDATEGTSAIIAEIESTSKESFELTREFQEIGLQMSSGLMRASYADASGSGTNKLVYYNQKDSRWANTRIGGYGSNGCTTIGAVGCLLTSFTMMLNRYGVIKNPQQVNAEVGTYACPLYWHVTANQYGLQATSLYVNANDEWGSKNTIIGAIVKNKPVIVGMTNLDTYASHYVVAYSYYRSDSDLSPGFIHLMDPDKWTSNGLDNDYMARWYIHQLYTYGR